MVSKAAKRKLIQEVKAFQDLSLVEMTTQWLIANWYSFSKEEKMKVALTIAPKGISDKHEHSGSFNISEVLARMETNRLLELQQGTGNLSVQ